jgi:hypothetical protein
MTTFYVPSDGDYFLSLLRTGDTSCAPSSYEFKEALLTGEIGTYTDCVFIKSYTSSDDYFACAPSPPKQITHGPQRKGRGGKIKRW